MKQTRIETTYEQPLAAQTQRRSGRRARRSPTELPCRIVSHYSDEAVAHHITEVSARGAWVNTRLPLHPGAEVVVCVKSPGSGREVNVFAHVARIVSGRLRGDKKPFGMALSFAPMTADERKVLEGAA